MKRVATLLVSLALPVLVLAACADPSPQQQTTPDPEPEPTAEPAPDDNEPLDIGQIFEGADDAVEVPTDGSWFEWDGDGDGTPEKYALDFQNNGDEARSGYIVTCYREGIDGDWLDGAYGIRGLYAYTSADGTPMLGMLYDAGDFYSHDNLGCATMHVEDDQLVIDYLR